MLNFDELKNKLPEIYQKRLEHELDVIVNNGIQNFMPYFITLADIIQYAKNKGILVGPARGCLLPDVLIYTKEQGFIPIKDVKINQTVITHQGNEKKVKNTFEYDYDGEIYEINSFGYNFESLRVTYDHKIFVKQLDNSIVWKQAKDLTLDDRLFIPQFKLQQHNNIQSYDFEKILKLKTHAIYKKTFFKYKPYHVYYPCGYERSEKYTVKKLVRVSRLDRESISNFVHEPERVNLRSLYILDLIAKNSKLNGIHELRKKMLAVGQPYEYLNKLITINKDFCFLMGVLNSSISFRQESPHTFFIGTNWKKKESVIFILFEKIFGYSIKITRAINKKNKQFSYQYKSSSPALYYFFRYFFDQTKIYYKSLTHLVNEISEENLKNFFAGFLFGCYRDNEVENTFIVYNKKYALDLRILLFKLSIPHNIHITIGKTGKPKYNFTLFLTNKPFFQKEKDGMWLQIKDIKRYKLKTKVHDLEVEDDHSFLTDNGIVHNSAGGSLAAYLLGITSIDPIKYNLPFARFLSNSRLKKSVPDIDVDFEVNEQNPELHRDKVNDYIFEKYGERAAQIATFGMLKLKNSLQDSFRINVSQPTENKIQNLFKEGKKEEAETLTHWLKNERAIFDEVRKNLGKIPIGVSDLDWLEGYNQDDIYYPGLLETNENFKNWAAKYPKIIETAKLLLGIPRNIGKHAAGVVIANQPIHEICGVMKIDGKNVISYNKKDVAKLGLIKNDNLGLTCLNFIGDTLRTLKQKNIVLDPWDLPEDLDVFKTFLDGKCLTVFQHETTGGASFVKKLIPQCKEDLFISVALNRPGALDAKIKLHDGSEMSAADVYIERKNNRLPLVYLHNDLEPILKNTFGVYAFQEQVMASLQLLLGYSEEESDSIRSAISDKNPQAFDEVKKRLPMLLQRGWTQNKIDDFFQQIIAFSGYAFNRSHACAYGLLAYATAYLKYHYPMEWWAAVLSNSKPDEVIEKYWQEVNSFVIEPNINISKNSYIIQGNQLIPPLNLIKGVGEAALKEISLKSPFQSMEDFMERIDKRSVNKGVISSLLKSGAMNCLFLNNPSLSDKFNIYFTLKAQYEHKKKTEIEEKHINITPYEEYLLAKGVLPISNILLSKAIADTSNINKPFINVTYHISHTQTFNVNSLRGTLPLVDGKKLNYIIDNIDSFQDNYFDVCCYGYVVVLRNFSYFSKTYQVQKSAIEINLDFDNFFHKIVAWPNKTETSPRIAKYIIEKQVFLFKLRIDKAKKILSIVGIEEITKTSNPAQ